MYFVTAARCCALSKYVVCVEVETDLLELHDLVAYVRKCTTCMSSFSVLTLFVASPLIFTFQATKKKTNFYFNFLCKIEEM
jgi:hypothetical protein